MIFINGLRVRVGNEFVNGVKVTLPPIPANTLRVRTNDGQVPVKIYGENYETATLVPGTTDVYDVYKSGNDFSRLLYYSSNVIEVLGGNTTGITNMEEMFTSCRSLTTVETFDTSNVTNMHSMFNGCDSLTTIPLFNTSNVTDMNHIFASCKALTTVPLFDTSKVTNMYGMFWECYLLEAVPLFDTSIVTDMKYMFYCCYKVETGALDLYQQASSQTNPPSDHFMTFNNCGRDTETGAAELAQIPNDWK